MRYVMILVFRLLSEPLPLLLAWIVRFTSNLVSRISVTRWTKEVFSQEELE